MAVDQDAAEISKRLASLALQASNVCASKTHMAHLLLAPFASHLYEVAALLKEMQREAEIRGAGLPFSNMNDMDSHVKAAEQLVQNYSGRSSLYLLMCCPDLLCQLKQIYGRLNATLDSFCSDAGWSGSLKGRFSDEMHALQQSISTKVGPKEQSLHDSLEQGVLDSIVTDAALTMKLAKQISDALGFSSVDSEGFENEVSKLKLEKDGAERRRGMGHALYLQQFIILLEKAMAAASSSNYNVNRLPIKSTYSREDKVHHLKSGSGGGGGAMRDTLVLPLQSFICPITKDVMKDPVQIASGQTYERQAIERWFADGHSRCPTGVELANTHMKSNIALKQSIAEWKDRNNSIRLEVATEWINSGIKEHQLKSLGDLQALCQEDSLYKYKVASCKSQLVPLLLHLAESSDLELGVNAFSLLGLLAENEECQQLMVKEKVIDVIVRCLARQNDAAVQRNCVQLMRILSSKQEVADKISRAPSAVLFLVTLIQDEQCAHNVEAILENLPKSDENVVIMAEANMMKPLIERLNHGEDASKVLMAKTLGRLHMPDSSKAVAATEETMRTLASMAESSREEEREAALMALESLTCVAAARRGLRQVGALGTLLNVMKGVRHSQAAKRGSAATLANLWAADDFRMSDAEVEDAVRIILELLGPPTPVQVQVCMLQGLVALARSSSNAGRDTMRENDAFTCLLRLFGVSVNDPSTQALRCPCLELLACLASSFRDEAARTTHSNPAAVHALANVIRFENPREAELLAATSFLACLPSKDEDTTRLMLSESDLLHALMSLLKSHRNEAVVEAAAGALLRFTLPNNLSMQATLAKAGVIRTYVGLLRSGGVVSKERAGRALCNFSKSSLQLSHAAEEATQAAGVWACLAGGAGRGWRGRRRQSIWCRVHGGRCSVEGTFCLVEADAVGALGEVVRSEGADGSGAQAAALMALATLVEQGDVEEGCSAIERAGGWSAIIGLMASSMPQVQEKAAHLCEKLFSIPRYRTQYAARAQMHIITLAQRGPPPLKQLAGRLLRHLELLHSQSDYFGVASITTSS